MNSVIYDEAVWDQNCVDTVRNYPNFATTKPKVEPSPALVNTSKVTDDRTIIFHVA